MDNQYPALASIPDNVKPTGLFSFLQSLKNGYDVLTGQLTGAPNSLIASSKQDAYRGIWEKGFVWAVAQSTVSVAALNTPVRLKFTVLPDGLDSTGKWSESRFQYSVRHAGIYQITAHVSCTGLDASGTYQLNLHAGVWTIAVPAIPSTGALIQANIALALKQNDVIYFELEQTAGTAQGSFSSPSFINIYFLTERS